ncbi:MAG: diacylglycerol kinase family protein [Bacteroidales bacterium]|jgi:diacylglycerol kinase family enzyme|nr:diacylglycerol kinase family protein [Bacteroidales bacterium]
MKSDNNNILAIFNGRNFDNKKIDKLTYYLKNQSVDYTFSSETTRFGDILKGKSGYDGYLIFGGDGSIHETINALFGSNKWISFFPGGTVNCIAGYFKMKRSVSFIDSFLQSNQSQHVDLLKINFYTPNNQFTKYAMGFVAIGHMAGMTIDAEKYRWMPRFIRYPFVGFLSFFRIHKIIIDLQNNNKAIFKKHITSLVINNCSAERFTSLKKADYQDGTFEYLMENNNFFSQVASIYSQYYSLFSKSKWIKSNNELKISFNKPIPVMVDGEIYQTITKMELSICPAAQVIKLPAKK